MSSAAVAQTELRNVEFSECQVGLGTDIELELRWDELTPAN